MLFSLNSNPFPDILTQPICLAGTPTIKAKGFTSLLITAPLPISAYSPIVTPQMIVAFAPIEQPFLRSVFLNSSLRYIKALGFITFVKTIDGPRKTSSSISTPS